MCLVDFTFIHNGLYMIKQNLTLNSLMWDLLSLVPRPPRPALLVNTALIIV